jgi:hypothetical protein
MKIILIKSWEHDGVKYPIGYTLEVFDPKAKEMIMDGIAERYEGERPPKEKMKSNLFKRKK